MKLVSVKEMVAIEREADASGLSYTQMMENAGRGLGERVDENYGYTRQGCVLGLVGSGNNGGDTLVALGYLVEWGWCACAYLARPRPAEDPLVERLVHAGVPVYRAEDDPGFAQLETLLRSHTVVLDGVLGTGMRLPLKPEVAEVLDYSRRILAEMEEMPVVVAVDCPSGVDCDTGEAAPQAIPADLTVTMAAIKQGLLKFPAYDLVGELELVGIGLPQQGESLAAWRAVDRWVADETLVRKALPIRRLDSHKGTFGTALVAAGSTSYTGAALLAGEAAYRSGAGLVSMAVPAPLHAALAGILPEAIWQLLPHQDGNFAPEAARVLHQNIGRATALLIGPGMGASEPAAGFLKLFLQDSTTAKLPPMVVDADGLRLLSRLPGWPRLLPSPSVLTPHPGEMSALTRLATEEIQADRESITRRFSQEWGHVVVLKGAFTVVASPEGSITVIPVATPALARAGSGDVLAGLICGLRAQGVAAYPAAVAGAWIHAQSGLRAAFSQGNAASVLARDVLQAIPDVMTDLA